MNRARGLPWMCWTLPLVLFAGATLAADTAVEPARTRPFVSRKVIEKLELTPAQTTAVNQLQQDFLAAQDRWMSDQRPARNALREQLEQARETGDVERVAKLRDQWRAHFGPLNDLRAAYRERLVTLLPPAQRQLLAELWPGQQAP